MLLFCVNDLSQSFNGNFIFQKVSFELNIGEKVALVGPNGIGKTSLLKIIAGMDRPASGKVTFFKPVSSAFLSQNPELSETVTVRAMLEGLETENHLSIGEVLKKFDFTGMEDHFVQTLSGGEKTRLQLAQIWLSGAEFLMLDEPSNHLDSESLTWLEGYIRDYPGTVIVVSHDRYFLDHTVNRVLELSASGIVSYPGNYTAYRRVKQERFEKDTKSYFEQEKRLNKLDATINEKKSWAAKAHNHASRKAIAEGCKKGGKPFYRAKAKKMDKQVQNTVKRLERLKEEQIARPKTSRAIDLSFTAGQRGEHCILSADRISKSWGERILLSDLSFTVKYGEKIGLLGPNGAGKTTLLQMIDGMEAVSKGAIWRSPTLRIGYLDQETKRLTGDKTVLEEIIEVCPDQREVRNLLAGLLLPGETVFKPCRVLSMGERVRVALAKLLLGPYDLLLLDEPTNYLDLESREKLEEALLAFGGSIIVVSHDRYLMEQVTETVWNIQEQRIRIYPGCYSEYLQNQLESNTTNTKSIRLELELKKARLMSELSQTDRARNEAEYLRLEAEFFETVKQLQN